MESGTWTLTGNATTIWNTSTATNLTITATTAIIDCTYSGATGTRTINAASATSGILPTFKFSAGTDLVKTSTSFYTSLDFTGFAGTWGSGGGTQTLSGNLTLGSGMGVISMASLLSFIGSTASITSNGIAMPSLSVTYNASGGTMTLADNLSIGGTAAGVLTITQGIFNANNNNITAASFSSSNSNTRTLTMCSGTWTLTGTGTVWNTATTTGLTLNAGTSTIVVNDASASSKTIASGVTTLYNLTPSGS